MSFEDNVQNMIQVYSLAVTYSHLQVNEKL